MITTLLLESDFFFCGLGLPFSVYNTCHRHHIYKASLQYVFCCAFEDTITVQNSCHTARS